MTEPPKDVSSGREKRMELEAFIAAANAAAVTLSQSALRALLLLNGGAAIAMLGFVASITPSRDSGELNLGEVVLSLQAFAIGAALSVLATGFAYVVMYLQAAVAQSFDIIDEYPYFRNGPQTRNLTTSYKIIHVASVLIAFFALVAFAIGVVWTGEIVSAAEQSR